MSKFARLEVTRPVIGLNNPSLIDDVGTLADEVFSVPSGSIVQTSDYKTFETRKVLFNPVHKDNLRYYLATSIVNNVGLAGFNLFTTYQHIQDLEKAENDDKNHDCLEITFDELELVSSSLNPDSQFIVLRTLPALKEEQENAQAKLEKQGKKFRDEIKTQLTDEFEPITDELTGRIKIGSLKAVPLQQELLEGYISELRSNILPVRATLGILRVDFSS